MVFKYIFYNKEMDNSGIAINLNYFADEAFISTILPNTIFFYLLLFIYLNRKYVKTLKHWVFSKYTYHLIQSIIFLGLLTIAATHTFYQWGSLGKNLSQFNIDFVYVNYSMADKMETIEGIMVFRDNEMIVIRDSCNNIHYIKSDQYHVKNISKSKLAACNQLP